MALRINNPLFLCFIHLFSTVMGCDDGHLFPGRRIVDSITGSPFDSTGDTGSEPSTSNNAHTENETDTLPVIPTEPGLKGQYFSRYNLDGFVFCRPNEQIDFNWSDTALDGFDNLDGISARWEGYVTPDYSELYTFELQVDDGARLWIDGQLIIDQWFIGRERSAIGKIDLTKDTPVKITLEFFNHRGPAIVSLIWQSDSLPAEIIPLENFNSAPCGDAPQPVPPTELTGTCLQSDDFNDGEIASHWIERELAPIVGIGVEETTSINLTTNLGYKLTNSVLDTGAYLFQPIQGDMDIQFRIDSINGVDTTEFGLMMRQAVESDAPMVFIGLTTIGSVTMLSRAEQGSIAYNITGNIEPATLTFPAWVRLKKTGDTVTAYVSSDGVTWQLVNSTSWPFSADLSPEPVGIALSTGSGIVETSAATGDDFVVNAGACAP